MKRCGVSDTAKVEDYKAEDLLRTFTYCVRSSVEQFTLDEFRDLAKEFWKPWENHADFRAVQILDASKAHLVIYTARGPRSDLDSQGGTLAYASVGPITKKTTQQLIMVFDLDENWGRDNGTRILNVGRHEAGHVLSLLHSNVKTALMAPYYSAGVSMPQMNDDVTRIQSVYGASKTPPPSGNKTVVTLECEGVVRGVTVRVA